MADFFNDSIEYLESNNIPYRLRNIGYIRRDSFSENFVSMGEFIAQNMKLILRVNEDTAYKMKGIYPPSITVITTVPSSLSQSGINCHRPIYTNNELDIRSVINSGSGLIDGQNDYEEYTVYFKSHIRMMDYVRTIDSSIIHMVEIADYDYICNLEYVFGNFRNVHYAQRSDDAIMYVKSIDLTKVDDYPSVLYDAGGTMVSKSDMNMVAVNLNNISIEKASELMLLFSMYSDFGDYSILIDIPFNNNFKERVQAYVDSKRT